MLSSVGRGGLFGCRAEEVIIINIRERLWERWLLNEVINRKL